MGKAGKLAKRRRLMNQGGAADGPLAKKAFRPAVPLPSPPPALSSASGSDVEGGKGTKRTLEPEEDNEISDVEELVGDLIPSHDLALTIQTLTMLEENPAVIRGKGFKALRATLHRLQTTMARTAGVGAGNTLSGRISDALTDGRWNDAHLALAEMRERGQTPKLGALQRWVRDCDAVSSADKKVAGDKQNEDVLRVLDAILRTADPDVVPALDSDDEARVVQYQPPWTAPSGHAGVESQGEKNELTDEEIRARFRVVAHEKGPERRTPNRQDFIMYTSLPGTITPSPASSTPLVTRIDVPNVPGAFLLQDVLTAAQCAQILRTTEAVGYTPDEPIAGAASEQTSVLAHNLFWLADTELLGMIFDRVKEHLPQTLPSISPTSPPKLAGINSRWRVYRYVPGAVYRPHIDGAWPASGLDPQTGEYVYDMYKDRRSKLTFLVYLNDGFDGGHTTFFIPSAVPGKMNAYPVQPRAGCVLCFPHGEAKGALLHEGSPVIQGKKYIIRADVLYTLPDGGGAMSISDS
ncbi:uncharacterized protein EV422DRAFT_544490 [Fimicolochytrium jonesii]|uniref:uncharacterized protein n=1 Tax=Fimicolochytrium jonesii TaxID=1396493 RepID=UPI0022FE044E|nr:uncharacterized protein EV422DRAFT_544490 [Fimicolochytrium jonesii]KAI8816679.1 hypothetical protein EV422DRAFT_544490 [Fimicolochytrium jonesii]